VLAPLLALHLLIVAFWAGSLLPLMLVMSRESRSIAVRILARFSTIAGWLVPGILIAGLGMALLLITDWSVLRQGYGLLLLAKLGGYVALLSLAAWNRWRLLPALADAQPRAPAMLRRSVATEALLIIAVLSLSAVLTLFFAPEPM
jgi:putative copper export protein